MKNLAVFHPSSELYGADRILVIALKSMTKFRPIIYIPSHGPLVEHIKQNLPSAIIKVTPKMPLFYRDLIKPKHFYAFTKNMSQFKKQFKQDNNALNFQKIYFNTLSCSPIAYLLRKLPVPKLFHVHEIIDNPKIARIITARIAFKYSEKVICVSGPVAENLLLDNSKYSHKVDIVHNGIAPLSDKIHQSEKEKIQFYLFGRIKPEKGQWFLIDALQHLDKSILEKAEFNLVGGTLAGKEHLLSDLKSKITDANLTPYINYIPFIENISTELIKADVCLVPSMMRDPFPTTVLEAMSAAKAVIATNHGGAVEAIENHQTGFLIDPDSPKQLAEKIETFILSRDMALEMGLKGRKIFDSNFTLDQFNIRWSKATA